MIKIKPIFKTTRTYTKATPKQRGEAIFINRAKGSRRRGHQRGSLKEKARPGKKEKRQKGTFLRATAARQISVSTGAQG